MFRGRAPSARSHSATAAAAIASPHTASTLTVCVGSFLSRGWMATKRNKKTPKTTTRLAKPVPAKAGRKVTTSTGARSRATWARASRPPPVPPQEIHQALPGELEKPQALPATFESSSFSPAHSELRPDTVRPFRWMVAARRENCWLLSCPLVFVGASLKAASHRDFIVAGPSHEFVES